MIKMESQSIVKKQGMYQHELIRRIMLESYKKNKKVWFFAYELMGHFNIAGESYYMSYKASTRVSEMSGHCETIPEEYRHTVVSLPTKGTLHVYALREVLEKLPFDHLHTKEKNRPLYIHI